jgi:hypothetical protein
VSFRLVVNNPGQPFLLMHIVNIREGRQAGAPRNEHLIIFGLSRGKIECQSTTTGSLQFGLKHAKARGLRKTALVPG